MGAHQLYAVPSPVDEFTRDYVFERDCVPIHLRVGITPNRVSDTHTEILFSSEDFIVLRAFGKLVLRNKILGFLPGPTALVSSQTDFHCYLRGDKLLVEGSTVERCSDARTVGCSGKTWIRESWHTEFSKQIAIREECKIQDFRGLGL